MAEVIAETDRLRLRTWDYEDRAKFNRHLNTPNVMRWLGGVSEEDYANAEIADEETIAPAAPMAPRRSISLRFKVTSCPPRSRALLIIQWVNRR